MSREIITEIELRELYVDRQMTDVEIANLVGCHKQTIYKSRKRFGVNKLKRWERNKCEPSEEQLQVIYGTLLGDGSISNGKKDQYKCESQLEVKHGPKQKSYTSWKYHKLANLCKSPIRETKECQWRFRTFYHPFFSSLRKSWYPNGNKKLSNIDLNLISPLGLAVWYMDDGSLIKSSNFIKISTCSFSLKDHMKLIKWLKKSYSISASVKNYSGYLTLVIDLNSRKEFVKIVKPHVTECMKYKVTFREYYTWKNDI